MALARKHPRWWTRLFGSREEALALALDLLRHGYLREKQHAMRYRQHAERMRYTQFRAALVRLAQAEDRHAELIARQIEALGETPPEVIPVRVAREQNSWSYLRTDLDEELRCAGELEADLSPISAEFPAVAELLRRVERDGRRHRAELRDMLARSDPQAAALA